MSSGVVRKYDVLIAGAGPAGSLAARRLLDFGFRPLIVAGGRAAGRSAEAIPETVLRFEGLFGVRELLAGAGAVAANNFEVDWGENSSFQKSGTVWHVDRAELAKCALKNAVAAGAALISADKYDAPEIGPDDVRLKIQGVSYEFQYMIDATGRAAHWSRPRRRAGNETARLFLCRSSSEVRPGRLVGLESGWAYRIDLPGETTVGVVRTRHDPGGALDPSIAARLDLAGAVNFRSIGVRPAFPQWAAEPCRETLISVGDAALAHNPVAGQGIRFAMSSAAAAAVVLRTCRELPADKALAFAYYRDLIENEKRGHLSYLNNLPGDDGKFAVKKNIDNASEAALELPNLRSMFGRPVKFSAAVKKIGIRRDELIRAEDGFELETGGYIRWLGRYDLLKLRLFCREPRRLSALYLRLLEDGLPESEALLLLKWCLIKKVLTLG